MMLYETIDDAIKEIEMIIPTLDNQPDLQKKYIELLLDLRNTRKIM